MPGARTYWDDPLHPSSVKRLTKQPLHAKEHLMLRLPDEFRALLRLEAASGQVTVEADVSSNRMATAKIDRLYRYALRHPAGDRDQVLREVARQTLRHGPAHVLGRRTREARLFMSWGHQVHREVFEARAGLRFEPGRAPRQLVASWRFKFPVVDLVLRDLHRQLRDYTLIVEDGPRRYVHDGCGIRLETTAPRTLLGAARGLGRRPPPMFAST